MDIVIGVSHKAKPSVDPWSGVWIRLAATDIRTISKLGVLVMTLSHRGHCRIASFLIAFSATLLCSASHAANISIQFSGLDIEYDGTDITADDDLTSVAITAGGSPAGPVLTSDISIDALIPEVVGIDVAGDTVVSDPGGSLDLSFPAGDSLELELGAATVNYFDAGFVQFTFAAAIATIDSQSLPFDLTIGDPVSISFSTQVVPGTLMDNGVVITAFEATGTGEVQGALVPEPSSVALLLVCAALPITRRWF